MILFGSDTGFDPRIMLTPSSSILPRHTIRKIASGKAEQRVRCSQGATSSRKRSLVSSELNRSSSADRDGSGEEDPPVIAVDYFG
jgi:hypothetical protein